MKRPLRPTDHSENQDFRRAENFIHQFIVCTEISVDVKRNWSELNVNPSSHEMVIVIVIEIDSDCRFDVFFCLIMKTIYVWLIN